MTFTSWPRASEQCSWIRNSMHVLNTAGVKVSVMESLNNGKIHITVSEGQNSMASGSPRMDRTLLASTIFQANLEP